MFVVERYGLAFPTVFRRLRRESVLGSAALENLECDLSSEIRVFSPPPPENRVSKMVLDDTIGEKICAHPLGFWKGE